MATATRRSLITTPPTAGLCRCGRPVLRGVSEGLRTTVDPVPLSPVAQVLARQIGVWVYRLSPTGLHLREYVPEQRAYWVVVPAHRCALVWPSGLLQLRQATPVSDVPPF